jgi:TRAP-type C4-dicarboxylate transport system permease large subunit
VAILGHLNPGIHVITFFLVALMVIKILYLTPPVGLKSFIGLAPEIFKVPILQIS